MRVITDNGSNYRPSRLPPDGHLAGLPAPADPPLRPPPQREIERYQRILAEELLYARPWTSEDQRAQAIAVWNIHYNCHRPHTAAGGQPPATRLQRHITNVTASYT